MIINLTQHVATEEQAATGVFDVEGRDKEELCKLLTFDTLPSPAAVRHRADAIASFAQAAGATTAMIGGVPFLMAPLEAELARLGISALYAFSKRESVEEALPGGGVKKVAVFRHAGFVPAAGASAFQATGITM